MSQQPPIAISSGQGWPAIQAAVRFAEVAAARVGGEVVIADGSGLPTPPAGELAPLTTW